MTGIYSAHDAIIGVQSALGGRGGGLRWLLRDEFTTDRAAGAVNGTAAEPGPGTRGGTDTGNNLSHNGGKMIAAGIVTGGDPARVYDAQARIAGKVLIAQLNITTMRGIFGWSLSATPSAANHISIGVGDSSGVNSAIIDGAYIPISFSAATDYKFAFIPRSAGGVILAKGGAFTNWTLLLISANGTTATLYPALAARAVACGFTSEFVRIPDVLWLPTPLVSDGYGSSYGVSDGRGHAEGIAGGIGAGGAGVVFSNVNDTWSTSGGKAINTPSLGANIIVNGGFDADTDWTKGTGWSIGSGVASVTGDSGPTLSQNVLEAQKWYLAQFTVSSYVSGAVYGWFNATGRTYKQANDTFNQVMWATGATAGVRVIGTGVSLAVDDVSFREFDMSELLSISDLSCSDVYASVAITRSDASFPVGLALNWDSDTNPANGVIVHLQESRVYVDKCVAGTWTNVSSTIYTYSAGARLEVHKSGTEYRVYYNNALVTSQTIADAGIVSNTLHGIFSTNASNTLDDLTIYATGTNGEYAALDKYSS